MGKKNKLKKFADLGMFKNVYENFDMMTPKLTHLGQDGIELKGKWKEKCFKNDRPIILELACGRGEYTVALAQKYPDINFVGIDIKGARIWKGAKTALDQNLENVAFLRTRIEAIEHFFDRNDVDEIWITFPDPFPRSSSENRRLTSQNFLDRYRKILSSEGKVHLKTDADSLYEYTLDTIDADDRCSILYQNDNIYSEPLFNPDLDFKTYYERMHLAKNKTIKYVQFKI